MGASFSYTLEDEAEIDPKPHVTINHDHTTSRNKLQTQQMDKPNSNQMTTDNHKQGILNAEQINTKHEPDIPSKSAYSTSQLDVKVHGSLELIIFGFARIFDI